MGSQSHRSGTSLGGVKERLTRAEQIQQITRGEEEQLDLMRKANERLTAMDVGLSGLEDKNKRLRSLNDDLSATQAKHREITQMLKTSYETIKGYFPAEVCHDEDLKGVLREIIEDLRFESACEAHMENFASYHKIF